MIIDCHVHFVGDGSSGSGCRLTLRTPLRRFLGRHMVRGIGLPASALAGGFDATYLAKLLEWVRGSSLDRIVLLAQDHAHRDDGTRIEDEGSFHVPNDWVLRLGREHPEIIPAASIHPARPDAMAELERCLEGGARVLKLLPNCHNVDCSAARHRPFWEMMARHGMILLAHTGGEATLPVLDRRYESPEPLRLPLDCGVKVIAAHGAGRNHPLGAHYTDRLVAMMAGWPNLFADNSALTTMNRHGTVRHLLPARVQERVVHGSDYPVPIVPFGPWAGGLLSLEDAWRLRAIANPLERDYQAKRLMGFSDDTFTRMASLLG